MKSLIIGIVIGVLFFVCIFELAVIFFLNYYSIRKNTEAIMNEKLSNKHLLLFQLMNEWVIVKQEGICLDSFFTQRGYKTIAIYGFNSVGRTLFSELSDSSVEVVYAIDQQAEKIIAPSVKVFKPNEDLPKVDVVVVTPITYFEEIESSLEKKMNCPIISLEDIVFDV